MKNKQGSVGGSALALSASKVINLLLSMIVSMILSRYLSLSEYGTYSELQTVTSLVVSIFALGLPNSINYFLASCDIEYKRKFLGFYYSVISIIAVIVAVLMFVSKGLIAEYYGNSQLTLYSFFLMIIPWTKIAISSRSNMLIVDSKIKKELIYSCLNSFALLLIAVLATVQTISLYFYLWAYVAVEIAFSVFAYVEAIISSKKRLSFNFDKKLLKSVVAFSIPLGLSTAISTLSLDMDKLIIGFFMEEADVAIYANAGKELPFSLIATSFTAIVLPKIVKNIKEDRTNESIAIWKNSTELCFIILCFCACASIVFAPQIISLLYSETYLAGVTIFRVYSLVLLFRITYWGMILNAYGKTKLILYNSLICLGVNLVLSISLYYLIGFEGPAIASLISIGVMAFAQLIHSAKLAKIKLKHMFSWKNMLIELAICAFMGVAVWGITELIDLSTTIKGIVIAIGIGIAWAAVYFAVMFKRIKRIWKEI